MKAFKTKSSTEGWSWMKAMQKEVDQQSLVKGKIPLGLSDSAQGFPSPPPQGLEKSGADLKNTASFGAG